MKGNKERCARYFAVVFGVDVDCGGGSVDVAFAEEFQLKGFSCERIECVDYDTCQRNSRRISQPKSAHVAKSGISIAFVGRGIWGDLDWKDINCFCWLMGGLMGHVRLRRGLVELPGANRVTLIVIADSWRIIAGGLMSRRCPHVRRIRRFWADNFRVPLTLSFDRQIAKLSHLTNKLTIPWCGAVISAEQVCVSSSRLSQLFGYLCRRSK